MSELLRLASLILLDGCKKAPLHATLLSRIAEAAIVSNLSKLLICLMQRKWNVSHLVPTDCCFDRLYCSSLLLPFVFSQTSIRKYNMAMFSDAAKPSNAHQRVECSSLDHEHAMRIEHQGITYYELASQLMQSCFWMQCNATSWLLKGP